MNLALPQWHHVENIETVLVAKHDLPLVRLHVSLPFGSEADADKLAGLTHFMGEMLFRGTRQRSRQELEDTLDHLGAKLSLHVGHHSFNLEGEVLTRNLDPFFSLILEVLTEPSFPEKEIQALKEQIIALLYLRLEDDAQLARRLFIESIYQNHPYGREVMGKVKTIKTFSRDNLLKHYEKELGNTNILFGASGDLTREKLTDMTHRLLRSLPKKKTTPRKQIFQSHLEGREIILIDKPERTQTQFVLGHSGLRCSNPDYYSLSVFMTAFAGHMFQAQYLQEVRVKRGWSYGAYGALDARRDGGSVYMYTFPKVTDTIPALKFSIELFEKAIHGNGLKEEALVFAKKHLIRSFPFMIEIPEKILSERIYNRRNGKPDHYLETYKEKIEAVSPAEIRAVARKYLNTENLKVTMVCTAKDFENIGKELNAKSVQVVPYDQI